MNSACIISIRLLTTPDASVPGYIAVQPALSMRDHGDGIAGTADRKPFGNEPVDQRLDLVDRAHHEFDIATSGEADISLGVLVGDIAELADRKYIHLALRAGAHSPNLLIVFGDVMQHPGAAGRARPSCRSSVS